MLPKFSTEITPEISTTMRPDGSKSVSRLYSVPDGRQYLELLRYDSTGEFVGYQGAWIEKTESFTASGQRISIGGSAWRPGAEFTF